jgi:hydroxymethylbilane synthase
MSSASAKIRIGTRASNLAMTQSLEVKNLILQNTDIKEEQIEIIPITTSGDKIQDRNLAEIGGKGLFIKELEEALVKNKIDISVHSAKDVPPIINENTVIAAFTKRLDVRDCFISEKFNSFKELPQNSIIGTSSARRKAMLLRLRPDLKIVNFRGNVDSRLKKITNNEVDASILALCGLKRLNKLDSAKEIIDIKTILPSGGQGTLAIQVRKNDKISLEIAKKINDIESQICLESERMFLKELEASCATPVAVYACKENDLLSLKTMILDYDGSEIFETLTNCEFKLEKGIDLAKKAALKTKNDARKLLEKICK